jgi:hypothetical protein
VVVNNDVPLLNTETGSQEATLSSDVMSQLPQTNLGADWEIFTVLLPGAAGLFRPDLRKERQAN